ncbi:MAG: hypothetical protein DHS20C01_20650 [marine bacterium B5-7]|nr:MAG: hypothetical protein DHS20C01_20650 [marine bacterium B5-7]
MSQVRIQFTLFSAFYSPLIVTMAGGFLRDEGIDYEWSVAPPGHSAIEAVVSGSADVIQSAPSQAFTSLNQGRKPPVVHFAQINEMDGFFITARNPDENFDWNVLEGSEVVLFESGQPNAMFRYACHKAGINHDEIKAIHPGGADAIDRAFREGQGRFVQQQGPYPQQLKSEGLGSIVAQVGPVIGSCAFSSLAASPEWLDTPEAVAFTRAYRAARRHLNDASADEIVDLTQSWFPGIDHLALKDCIASYQSLGCWTPHIEIRREAFDVINDVFQYTGAISRRYDYDKVCCLPPDSC